MPLTLFRLFVAFALLCSAGIAAETTPEKERRPPLRLPYREAAPATATKTEPAPLPDNAVTVTDPVAVVPVVADPAEKTADPKGPAAEPQTPEEAEKVRVQEEANAFARGEGERYALRQKAYADARAGVSRKPAVATKSTSIAQAQLADGRGVVIVGGIRTVFATKAEADAYVAGIRRDEEERPFVVGSGPNR